jgi:hypothetical protein
MPNPSLDGETIKALEKVAIYFDAERLEYEAFFSDCLASERAGFVERLGAPRRRGGDLQRGSEIRSLAIKLADMAVKLFGSPLCGTIAKTVNIGMSLPKPLQINGDNIRGDMRGERLREVKDGKNRRENVAKLKSKANCDRLRIDPGL